MAPAFTLIYQTCIVAPLLPMSRIRLWTITTICAAATCTLGVVFILLIGFPVPFAIEFEAGPFLLILGTALWVSWKDTLRADPLARLSLKRYTSVLASQIVILQFYIAFNLVSTQLHRLHQTLLSCLLPLIKLFFKNWINRGVFHLKVLSPTVVVFSVDVFHALFVAFTMQQVSGNGANVVVIVVDVVQSCVAYYELTQVLTRIHSLVDQDPHKPINRVSQSSIPPTVSVFDYVAHVLHTVNDACIPQPRHSRGSHNSIIVFPFNHQSRRQEATRGQIFPSSDDFRVISRPGAVCLVEQATQRLSQHSLHRVDSVQPVLKLLHMIEFYVLVEYVEAMLSISYAFYLMVLSYLPSHQFYTQFNHLSSSELRVTAWRVGAFAAAEVLSLVLFCSAVDRKVKHFSTLRQLAFALETNGKLIYAVTIGWVFLIVQLSLEHFGSDYSFQFKWLKNNPRSATPGS